MGNANERSRRQRREEEEERRSVDTDLQRLVEVMVLRRELRRRQRELRAQLESRNVEVDLGAAGVRGDGVGGEGGRGRGGTAISRQTSRDAATGAGGGTSGAEEQEATDVRGLLRGLMRNPVLLDYFAGNLDDVDMVDDDDDDDDSDGGQSDENRSTMTATTYEGVPELFVEDDRDCCVGEGSSSSYDDEQRVMEKARKIKHFKTAVLEHFHAQKAVVDKQLSQALDVHRTLQDLLRDRDQADLDEDVDRLAFVQAIVDDMQRSDDFVRPDQLDALRQGLSDIKSNLAVLLELTGVRDDDLVVCPVCLSCPTGVVWDCVKCDNIVCASCRPRLTACPTCRVSFRGRKAPRRNRWAEKLARQQREKTSGDGEQEGGAATNSQSAY